MVNFKDFLGQDMSTFFNIEEFGELKKINNRDLLVVIDNERLVERAKKEFDGVSIGELLYFVRATEYGELPSINEAQRYGTRMMYVTDAKEFDGVYEIILSQNMR